MKNKRRLGTEEIFIDNDRTKKEREIQKKIAEMGKTEKNAKGRERERERAYQREYRHKNKTKGMRERENGREFKK